LKYLLKQTEIFTHFILQNNRKFGVANQDDVTDQFKSVLNQNHKARDTGGKASVSKRHQKKPNRGGEEDGD
jgi:hypothetical protein